MKTHTGVRAAGIGTILVVGSAFVGWTSRHRRMSFAPFPAEPASSRIEGGI